METAEDTKSLQACYSDKADEQKDSADWITSRPYKITNDQGALSWPAGQTSTMDLCKKAFDEWKDIDYPAETTAELLPKDDTSTDIDELTIMPHTMLHEVSVRKTP